MNPIMTMSTDLALALPMSTQPDMPLNFAIGTKKAFERNYAFPYTRRTINDETIYVCNKGSEYGRANEFLVLRHDAGTWTAWDSVIEDHETLRCRQPVFRSNEDITFPGWHTWEKNLDASRENEGSRVTWGGNLMAETRVES